MPLAIQLQDELGKVLEEVLDLKGYFAKRLPPLNDDSYYCLRFIDLYGDAYFNRGQMGAFISEVDRIFTNVQKAEEREIYNQIKALGQRCKEEVHLYLKIFGD